MSVDAESEHNRVCCLLFAAVAVASHPDIFLIAGNIGSS